MRRSDSSTASATAACQFPAGWIGVLPKLVIAPGFVLGFAFIYGFMIWNGVLSVTNSRMLPNYDEFVGLGAICQLVGDGPLVCGAEKPRHLQRAVSWVAHGCRACCWRFFWTRKSALKA